VSDCRLAEIFILIGVPILVCGLIPPAIRL
jgi:hypothetical protein